VHKKEATEMPLLDIFWTMLWFFVFVAWIWLLIVILTDVFRSRDLSGWGKALWTLFIVFLPVLGTLLYLIVRGTDMAERSEQAAIERDRKTRDYIRAAAPARAASTADELDRLAHLRNSGVLTEQEFEAQKAKLLARA
jgi:Phospholipase_D-nuclease N-terminal/Short C-terminal domain